MKKNKNKNEFDFSLDRSNSQTQTTELDFMFEKPNSKEKPKNNQNNENIDYTYQEIIKHFQNQNLNEKKLQVFISNELWNNIQKWKKAVGIKKDKNAIESLLRFALKMKQL